MSWEFFPQYFSENKIIGNILETSPTNTPINMSYVYDKKERLLKVEIFTDTAIGEDDKSETDSYNVTFSEGTPPDAQIIKINTTELKYILQKI